MTVTAAFAAITFALIMLLWLVSRRYDGKYPKFAAGVGIISLGCTALLVGAIFATEIL